MIKPILEEAFGAVTIIVVVWILGIGALSLYKKFRKVTNETKEKK